MFATDDNVGETEVLTVNRVHHRFFRAAVEHLDVEAKENDAIRNLFAELRPKFAVRVAFAERAVGDQFFIRRHPNFGVDVVALRFADERVQAGAGVETVFQEFFEPVNKRVLVRSVERVARLESDDAFPTAFGDQRANFFRRKNVLAERRVFRLRENVDFTAEEVVFVRVVDQNHIGAGVVDAFGEVNRLQVARFVPRENVRNFKRRDDIVVFVDKRDFLTGAQRLREFRRNREGERNRPSVFFAVVFDNRFVENAVKRRGVHRAFERR